MDSEELKTEESPERVVIENMIMQDKRYTHDFEELSKIGQGGFG